MSTPLRLVFNPTGDLLAAARDCEADVFMQWYGNTRDQLAEEYGPYERDSVFLTLVDKHDDAMASMRFLTGCTRDLKTVTDVQGAPWGVDSRRSVAAVGLDLNRAWDVATMGVRPGIRKGAVQLSFAMYHGFVTTMRVNAVHGIVAILDQRVRRLMDSVGLRTISLPGTGPACYLGSESSSPVYAMTAATLDRQRWEFPDAHRLITMGVGLDGVAVPDREHFRLETWLSTRLPARPLVRVGPADGSGTVAGQVRVGAATGSEPLR